MQLKSLSLAACFIMLMLQGCAGDIPEGSSAATYSTASFAAARRYTKAWIFNSDSKYPELSSRITAALSSELKARGISPEVANPQGASSSDTLFIVHTSEWKWDMVRYLGRAEIKVIDSESKQILGAADYSAYRGEGYFHDFPSIEKATRSMVLDLERRGIFATSR